MSREKAIEQAAQVVVDMDDCGLIVWENGITGIHAIKDLRKALDLPEDAEPYAWLCYHDFLDIRDNDSNHTFSLSPFSADWLKGVDGVVVPLYRHPPKVDSEAVEWQSVGDNTGMRFPEDCDTSGGATDCDTPKADDVNISAKRVDKIADCKHDAERVALLAERDELLKALEFIARNKPLLMTDQNQCEVLCYPLEINPSAIATQAIFKAKGGA
jgi:hypothetical protein